MCVDVCRCVDCKCVCVCVCVCYRQTDGRGRQSSKKRQTDKDRGRQRDTSEVNPCLEDEEDHEDVSRLCRRMRNKSACSSYSTQCSVQASTYQERRLSEQILHLSNVYIRGVASCGALRQGTPQWTHDDPNHTKCSRTCLKT